MTDVLNVRNTLNIEYNYDKIDQSTGYFTLDLRRDNKTYTPEELNNGDITYFNLSDHVVKTWPAKMINGKITLKAEDFPDLRHAGTYAITAIVDGIIFPSQGQCTLTLDGSFTQGEPIKTQTISGTPGKDGAGIESVNVDDSGNMNFTMTDGRTLTAKVTMPEAVKGDKGDSGLSAYQLAQQAGFSGTLQEWLNSLKGAKGDAGSKGDTGKGIKNVKYNDGDLFIYYTDGSNDAVSLPLLKGDTGKAGLGIKDVTLVGNTLSVVMDNGTSHQLTLPLLKGDKGDKGQDGANVSEITISGNTLFFHYTDGLTYSAQLPLLKGDPGEKGQDAPKIGDVSLNGNTLTFTLSDKSTYSVLLPLLKGDAGTNGKSAYEIAVQYGFKGTETEWLQSLKGSKGDPGEKGQDAPKITDVSLNNDQTQIIFHFSDGTDLQTKFQAPQSIPGPAGKNGKDAPEITSAKFNADQTKIIFTLSDSNTIEANFTPPHDGTIGKDGVGIKDVSYTGGYLNFTLSDDSVKSIKLELPSGPVGPSGKDAPTITKAEVTNNNLIFTLSDGKSVTAALPNLKGQDGKNAPTITKAEVKDKQLVFTLSDNSTVNVDISSLIKPDLTTSTETAGSTVITGTSVQPKPRNTSVINASLSEQMPVLRLNYKYEPLSLVYDKEYNEITLKGDTSGNVQSYRIDFSDIYDSLNNKLDNIIFTPNNQTVVLKPNSNQNDALVKFNVQKNKNGTVTNEEISTKLNIDTTQLGSGSSSNNFLQVEKYDAFIPNDKFKYVTNPKYYNINNLGKIVLDDAWLVYGGNVNNYYVYEQKGIYFVGKIKPLFKNNIIILPNDQNATTTNDIMIETESLGNFFKNEPYTLGWKKEPNPYESLRPYYLDLKLSNDSSIEVKNEIVSFKIDETNSRVSNDNEHIDNDIKKLKLGDQVNFIHLSGLNTLRINTF